MAMVRTSSGPGQAQDPLGDDVALDLAGPPGDGPGEGTEVLEGPGALLPQRRAGQGRVQGVRSQRLNPLKVEAALDLAAEELQHQVLRGGLPPGELGEAPV